VFYERRVEDGTWRGEYFGYFEIFGKVVKHSQMISLSKLWSSLEKMEK